MTDLPAKLMAAINTMARSEIDHYVDTYLLVQEDTDSARSPGWFEGQCECGWATSGDEPNVEDSARTHVVERHPPAIYSLCQSLREIVEFHMVCQADLALALENVAASLWAEKRERAKLEAVASEALTRLQLSDHYLGILANAYGLKGGGGE